MNCWDSEFLGGTPHIYAGPVSIMLSFTNTRWKWSRLRSTSLEAWRSAAYSGRWRRLARKQSTGTLSTSPSIRVPTRAWMSFWSASHVGNLTGKIGRDAISNPGRPEVELGNKWVTIPPPHRQMLSVRLDDFGHGCVGSHMNTTVRTSACAASSPLILSGWRAELTCLLV